MTAVDLLLLDDEAPAPASGRGQTATAKGLYAELQRQLQEPSSHLKRKSALGALIGRGASVRLVGCEAAPPRQGAHLLRGRAPAAARSEGASARSTASDSGDGRPAGSSPSGPAAGITRVPRIIDFPQSRSRPAAPLGGLDLFASLFSWVPSCSPASCKSLQQGQLDTCTIVVAPPEAHDACVPTPAKSSWAKDGSPDGLEAGLGGWPLCVPHAGAALQQGAAGAPSSPAAGPVFRKAAIEVDDAELAVILAPAQGQPSCNSPTSAAQTPSTASTTDSLLSRRPAFFPEATGYSRAVFSRQDITGVRLWPRPDDALCTPAQMRASADAGGAHPHVVEVRGTPGGAAQPLTLLLALPSGQLAARLHEALGRSPCRAQRAGSTAGPEAVRCELLLEAGLALRSAESEVNCAAVIRRGICEACHVGSERVWVCGLRDAPAQPGGCDAEAAEAPAAPPRGAAAEGAGGQPRTPEGLRPAEEQLSTFEGELTTAP